MDVSLKICQILVQYCSHGVAPFEHVEWERLHLLMSDLCLEYAQPTLQADNSISQSHDACVEFSSTVCWHFNCHVTLYQWSAGYDEYGYDFQSASDRVWLQIHWWKIPSQDDLWPCHQYCKSILLQATFLMLLIGVLAKPQWFMACHNCRLITRLVAAILLFDHKMQTSVAHHTHMHCCVHWHVSDATNTLEATVWFTTVLQVLSSNTSNPEPVVLPHQETGNRTGRYCADLFIRGPMYMQCSWLLIFLDALMHAIGCQVPGSSR